MTGKHRKTAGDASGSCADIGNVGIASPMGVAGNGSGLSKAERRAVVLTSLFRIAGTPVVAVAGLVSAGLMIRATGPSTYGIVALVATVGLLLPFADLGIGAVVTSAASRSRGTTNDAYTLAVIRRAYRVLARVTLTVTTVAVAVAVVDAWGLLLGITTGPDDRFVITLALIVFALTIPAGLGLRILIGIDRAQLVVLIMVSNSLFALLLTASMYACGLRGIWYVLPPLAGALMGNVMGTAVALKTSGLGFSVFRRAPADMSTSGLLEGALWLFVVSVGIPFGLQVQRIVLAHLSTPLELSRYAVMAQLYGLCWSVFSMAAMAFWPIFVKRRGAADETVRLWLIATMIFGILAALASVPLVLISPWLADVLSGGTIDISTTLASAFAVLLIAQCFHLPSGMLLTKPTEARWQAGCLAGMAIVTSAAAVIVAPTHGAAGVVLVTAAAVVLCQFIPDMACVPRLVGRRSIEPGVPNVSASATAVATPIGGSA